ncbi:septal ring lytic transglycosylase RlpA family protein [Labrenzia sp. 011]|uniref:septal ring lytic transglycosylase RlpA family protein n=1 Tax=Labrenzia sp. 011 TaxID=2171494 RepID=UPI000D519443|nr:septal ring lytic transglycosylase RlpA family protein [Labrenzia sp. 011]PVB59526.1 septal ring lytic transglycosylase RlpA family lipoprotein [Labrenzia sp. 011]
MGSSIRSRARFGAVFCALALLAPGAGAAASADAFQQCGKASWYKLGGMTASGEQADPSGLTAAHRTLPFGTLVKVTNLANGKTVTVRINDRGPYSKGRVIDVTRAAARKLGFIRKGVTRVQVSGTTHSGKKLQGQNCQ